MSMNVLKAEELMVGDWVLVEDIHSCEIGAMMPARVKQIYECGVIVDCGEGDEECEIFKAVPITAEILEKNGFHSLYDDKSAYRLFWSDEEEENYWSIVIDLTHPIASRIESQIGNSIKKNRKKREYWELKGTLKFVHELQHLMRQFKIDKEIEI